MTKTIWTIIYKSGDEVLSTVLLNETNMLEKRNELLKNDKDIIDIFLSEIK